MLRPDSADAHYGLADALAALGRWPEAIQRLNPALRLRPDDRSVRRPSTSPGATWRSS